MPLYAAIRFSKVRKKLYVIQINLFIGPYKTLLVFVAIWLHSASLNHIEIHTNPYDTVETVLFCAIPIFSIHQKRQSE